MESHQHRSVTSVREYHQVSIELVPQRSAYELWEMPFLD